ncbi:MAG: glycerol-3-phosphate dehydrogenase [Actinomycetia bacterium]|nr:glycerol-3-phosphate dehydrogenase [Actinomycetes bacterium]
MTFSAAGRAAAIDRMAREDFDVLVIGGGITGAGVAVDAASRGLRTALVERDDFASGTSSKSSKLVHGGIRYLRHREFGLVHEALRERQRLLENAPHLVEPLPFLFPVIAAKGAGKRSARTLARVAVIGLWMYDAVGGWRIGKLHKKISVDEALRHMPSLDRDRVTGAFVYLDGRTDDARLTLAILKTAAIELGATVANYTRVTGLTRADDRVTGAAVVDTRTGRTFDVRAKVVINAAGVWSDDVRGLELGEHPSSIRPAKGVHITVAAARLPVDIAAILQVTGDDRVVFVVPWDEHVYVGTTDTDYSGDLDDPVCTREDVRHLLDVVNACIDEPLTEDDVVSTWAGLRPLVSDIDASEKTADLSRKHRVITSDGGLITITGGKLTTYRQMAADAVDLAVGQLRGKRRARHSRTAKLRIHGAAGLEPLRAAGAAERFEMDPDTFAHLVGRYGGHARSVVSLLEEDPTFAEPLVAGLPYLRVEAVYAARFEMAVTLDDVLSRRTRALILDREAAVAAAPATAALLAAELGWDAREQAEQLEAFLAVAEHERQAQHSMPSAPGPVDAVGG